MPDFDWKKLAPHQRALLEMYGEAFLMPHNFWTKEGGLLSQAESNFFGDLLRLHHVKASGSFSKAHFEYGLASCINYFGRECSLAMRGNPGYDLKIDSERFSLKTQADRNLRLDEVWISKYMELGSGVWGDQDEDLKGLVLKFTTHLSNSDRVLILRHVRQSSPHLYELLEVPISLLRRATDGTLMMMHGSKQHPKPGYCTVSEDERVLFRLYFDGGGERKLQIKNLKKDLLILHATYDFHSPGE